MADDDYESKDLGPPSFLRKIPGFEFDVEKAFGKRGPSLADLAAGFIQHNKLEEPTINGKIGDAYMLIGPGYEFQLGVEGTGFGQRAMWGGGNASGSHTTYRLRGRLLEEELELVLNKRVHVPTVGSRVVGLPGYERLSRIEGDAVTSFYRSDDHKEDLWFGDLD